MFYKRKLDALGERVAGGSFACHSLTRASRCEVTRGDSRAWYERFLFVLIKQVAVSAGSPEWGVRWTLLETGWVFLNSLVYKQLPAPTRRAQSLVFGDGQLSVTRSVRLSPLCRPSPQFSTDCSQETSGCKHAQPFLCFCICIFMHYFKPTNKCKQK